jgi:dTDP-4-dehydrorhamnose 3,5-epimerase-like enzyme
MQQFATIVPHSLQKAENGDLGIVEFAELPFEPKRIYWITGVEDEKTRGHHAHKKLRQFFVALKGTFEVSLTDGIKEFSYTLGVDGNGLLLEPGLWREIRNFSDSSVLLVVCDQPYSEDDYIRDFDEYLSWTQNDS